jgi:hypothetical protein
MPPFRRPKAEQTTYPVYRAADPHKVADVPKIARPLGFQDRADGRADGLVGPARFRST